jgi:GT2 family glycosyltransferase/cephalosporin hydroxylase
MGSVKEISTIIVNRNTRELLTNCLESLATGFAEISYEVWVVDNASEDGSADMVAQDYPDVHLLRNDDNLGFSKANNQVLKKINTPFALLLNSDTILTKECISHLYNFLTDHPEAAIVGPKLISQHGKLQPSTYPLPQLWKDLLIDLKFYKFLPQKIKSKLFIGSFWKHNETRAVGRITGACILVRMDDVRSVNFLDENFFFYGEVHDFCWSLWEKDRQVWFNPESVVVHLGGETSKKMWNYKEQRRRMWRENEKFLRKHQPLSVVRIGILLKLFSLLLAIIKGAITGFSIDTSIDRDLLKVDFDWYSRRIKEWFWFRFRHFFDFYFERSFYLAWFQKKLIQKFYVSESSDFEFNTETGRIQEELTDKWNNSQDSWDRTGLMDFSCVALLYQIVRIFKPQVVVETGVANGASSTFILSAMEANGMGTLYSVDWSESEELSFVPKGKEMGWMVPDELRKRWHLQIGRTEEKLEPLLKQIGRINVFLHDSDHSYETMMYEYKTAWPYLVEKGFLLSDDVRMNTAFGEFTKDTESPTMIYKGRLGIAQKVKRLLGQEYSSKLSKS